MDCIREHVSSCKYDLKYQSRSRWVRSMCFSSRSKSSNIINGYEFIWLRNSHQIKSYPNIIVDLVLVQPYIHLLDPNVRTSKYLYFNFVKKRKKKKNSLLTSHRSSLYSRHYSRQNVQPLGEIFGPRSNLPRPRPSRWHARAWQSFILFSASQ